MELLWLSWWKGSLHFFVLLRSSFWMSCSWRSLLSLMLKSIWPWILSRLSPNSKLPSLVSSMFRSKSSRSVWNTDDYLFLLRRDVFSAWLRRVLLFGFVGYRVVSLYVSFLVRFQRELHTLRLPSCHIYSDLVSRKLARLTPSFVRRNPGLLFSRFDHHLFTDELLLLLERVAHSRKRQSACGGIAQCDNLLA